MQQISCVSFEDGPSSSSSDLYVKPPNVLKYLTLKYIFFEVFNCRCHISQGSLQISAFRAVSESLFGLVRVDLTVANLFPMYKVVLQVVIDEV